MSAFSDIRLLVGVCGGISAMGTPHALYWLRQKTNVTVDVVLSPAAKRFVTPQSFADLLGSEPYSEFHDLPPGESHVTLAQAADVVVVLPASANTLAKLSVGVSDNLLCASVLATESPVILMPATSQGAWKKPSIKRAVEQLRVDGYRVIEPEVGSSLADGAREVGSMSDFRKPLLQAIVSASTQLNQDEEDV